MLEPKSTPPRILHWYPVNLEHRSDAGPRANAANGTANVIINRNLSNSKIRHFGTFFTQLENAISPLVDYAILPDERRYVRQQGDENAYGGGLPAAMFSDGQ